MGEPPQFIYTEVRNKLQTINTGYYKVLLIAGFLLLNIKVSAPGQPVAFIFVSKPVDAYERIIKAVIMVESSGNTLAFNKTEEAFGAFQIRPIRLLDFNQRTGKKYTTEDCFNFEISKEIFLYYAKTIGFNDYQSIARKWNGSGKTTLDYWKRIKVYL
jgi:hypothetical protein